MQHKMVVAIIRQAAVSFTGCKVCGVPSQCGLLMAAGMALRSAL